MDHDAAAPFFFASPLLRMRLVRHREREHTTRIHPLGHAQRTASDRHFSPHKVISQNPQLSLIRSFIKIYFKKNAIDASIYGNR